MTAKSSLQARKRGESIWGALGSRSALASTLATTLPAALAFLAVAVLAASDGAYFPVAWGWAALILGWVASLALLLRSEPRARLELGMLAALLALVAWVALSTAWSRARPATVLEVERGIVYPLALLAALSLLRRTRLPLFLGAIVAGITAVSTYSLATRLFPTFLGSLDRLPQYRLAAPLGYWNGLGIFCAMGTIACLGLAAKATRPRRRAVAAAALVVLLPTLYFTFSRGAWVALAVGIAAAIALEPQRLRTTTSFLVALAAPSLAVWAASSSHALTRQTSAMADAVTEGRRLAIAIAALAAVSAASVCALALIEPRLRVGRRTRLGGIGLVATTLCLAIAVALVRAGGPTTIARTFWTDLTAPPVTIAGAATLNEHLFDLSSTGRIDIWRVALDDVRAHPLLGSGAGSFGGYWLEHRPRPGDVRDAHSLYLETLAELGPMGLLLLLAALIVPAVAAVRARRTEVVPFAFGAYAAFVVHAAVDWDWELPAVTFIALLLASVVLAAARHRADPRSLDRPRRAPLLVVSSTLAALSLVGLVGNSAIADGTAAADRGEWQVVRRSAETAVRWAPWAPEPWELRALLQLAQQRPAAARASLRRALARDPGDWRLWLELAEASSGRTADRALAEARRLNPRSPEVADFVRARGAG